MVGRVVRGESWAGKLRNRRETLGNEGSCGFYCHRSLTCYRDRVPLSMQLPQNAAIVWSQE